MPGTSPGMTTMVGWRAWRWWVGALLEAGRKIHRPETGARCASASAGLALWPRRRPRIAGSRPRHRRGGAAGGRPARHGKVRRILVAPVYRLYIAWIFRNDIKQLGVTHRGDTGSSAGVENSLPPDEHPKWACAELRSLMTATNPVSWPKTSFGSSAVHNEVFGGHGAGNVRHFLGPDCVRSARKG